MNELTLPTIPIDEAFTAASKPQVKALLLLDSTTIPHAELMAARATTDKPTPVGAKAKIQLLPPPSPATDRVVIGMELIPKIFAK
jgi:hypothetical protein